ncbi:hypothetical protein [Cohnella sp. 56]|uniref:hypothetical protein n=1 Tax=Cohnella sp. 56 TaxID=3113722 RepID=UPI0030E8E63E
MDRKQALLQRMDDIGRSLAARGDVLAVFGLGSVGVETDRIDAYSDLDFFVVTVPGSQHNYIERLDWLEEVCPMAYHFKNADVGHKILFEDGIYGEFAVFEEAELAQAQYTGGRMIWQHPSCAGDDIVNGQAVIPSKRGQSVDYVVGEALTNLYVGLGRYARGERLSAMRFIESYPIDGLLSVMHLLEPEVPYYPDRFGNERRAEARFPRFAARLPGLLQGYERLPESALCLLAYLEEIAAVSPRMSAEIKALAEHCMLKRGERDGSR